MAINSSFRTLSADNMEGVVYARNYLKNSFENNSTDGWNKLTVSIASSLPSGVPTVGGAAGASVTTFTASGISPLNGKYSLNAASSAAWSAGQGFISDAFTIDRMDAGKVLTVSFDYEVVSGATNANFSGTLGSQTFMVYIYDATAGAWVQPAGFLGMNQSSGPGRVNCTFQSSVTAGQQYRIAVIASVASTNAISLRFDNFTCSRQTAPIGPVVTDWVSYTPTGGWTTNTTYTGRWRRVGDSMEVQFGVALTGAPNAAALSINLPSGYSVDTSKLPTGSLMDIAGSGQALKSGTGYILGSYLATVTSVQISFIVNGASPAENNLSNTNPVSWANGDIINGSFRVPISGWSSNVQLSNDTDTRVISMTATTSGTSIPNGADTPVVFSNVEGDSTASYNSSTGVYTVPVSGDYQVEAFLEFSAYSYAAGQTVRFGVLKNGALLRYLYDNVSSATNANNPAGGGSTILKNMKAGDTIQITAFQNSGSAKTLSNDPARQSVSIFRLSGPSVVAASETVAARYYNTSGQSITAGSYQTITNWANTITGQGYDSHLFVNPTTGIITIPVSGKYQISASIQFNSASWGFSTSAHNVQIVISKTSGSAFTVLGARRPWNGEPYPTVNGTTTLHLNAGETLSIAVFQGNSSNSAISLRASQYENYFSIERVGN